MKSWMRLLSVPFHIVLSARNGLAGIRRQRMSMTISTPRLFKEDINMLYDSKCNLCLMEVKYLMKKDTQGRIKFTDLEDPSYNGNLPINGKVDYATGMKSMHAVLFDGEVISGVRVFRELYSAIGLGWLYAFTKYPVIGPLIDRLYDTWAVYRTDVTRGTPVEALIAQRLAEIEAKSSRPGSPNANDENACAAMKNM